MFISPFYYFTKNAIIRIKIPIGGHTPAAIASITQSHQSEAVPDEECEFAIKRTLVVMRRNCIPLSCHNRFSIFSLSTSITPKG